MKNELDSRLVLSVFEKIKEHGEVVEGGHKLENIKAYTDHDGYTIFLEDNQVSLRYGFHNQYHFDYEHADHLAQFESRLKVIEKMEF